MNRTVEKQLTERALALGNSGNGAVLEELIQMTSSPSAQVRRLCASAIGKLAQITNSTQAVATLIHLLHDFHPQVKQYSIKSLWSYGADSKNALHDLKDIAVNPAEKEYNRRDVDKAKTLSAGR